MSRNGRQQLQMFLDGQLERTRGEGRVGFDQIEVKLRRIEDRLVQLRNSSPPVVRTKYAGSQGKVEVERKEESYVVSGVKQMRSLEKQRSVKSVKKEEVEIQATPYKRLDIYSKAISQAHIVPAGLPPKYDSKPKSKSKCKTRGSDKKINRTATVQKLQWGSETKQNMICSDFKTSKKQRNWTSNSKTVLSKTSINRREKQQNLNFSTQVSSRKMLALQKEVETCWKSNNQLRKKVNQLKGYQTEFWKLKNIFDKCQKLRRKKLFKDV